MMQLQASPLTEHIARSGRIPDLAQLAALQRLGGLTDPRERRGPWRRRNRLRGLYLWGRSGRGKTWLMDCFFETAAVDAKRRMHFHQFLGELQRRLATRHDLNAVVRALLGDADLVCFDEFHVHDVADARYLTELIDVVLDRRITLVVTSNYPPSELLPNPLAHRRFTPTIAAIEANFEIVKVDGGHDYRATVEPRGVYVWPGSTAGIPDLGEARPERLDVGGRTVTADLVRGGEVRFTFATLCGEPTGTADYLRLAERFSTWVITDVPVLADCGREPRRRLCNVLDVLTDREAHVVLIGEQPPQVTFGGVEDTDWARTESRLRALTGV